MALLQITEPGFPQSPIEPRLAVGIDLGTTNSLVATMRNGRPETLPDEQQRHSLPSLVHYRAGAAPLVGYGAFEASLKDPANTVISVKRMMGRSSDDLAGLEQLFGYRLVRDNPRVPKLRTAAGDRSAVEVSADILHVLKHRAQQALNADSLDGAVITVPAHFDDAQRQATRDAAKLAGLEVYRLINEPTAAAVAYGLDRGDEEDLIAVFDLGGGTFDVSVLKLDKGVLRVLATGGDTLLGGDDFDRAIAEHLLARAPAAIEHTPRVMRGALAAARRAKEALSSEDRVECDLALPGGSQLRTELTRDEVEALIAPLVDKTVAVCRRVLGDADLRSKQVKSVVMVGGSTRVPLVRRKVDELFDCGLLTRIDPDKVVAVGAAIQADVLSGNRRSADEMLLLDVVPLSLGIETMNDLVEKIIPRNSVIPVAKSQDFTTYKDGQTSISLHVVQGERDLVDDCKSLARFELKGIPPRTAGAARVRVTFRVDADGLLSVEAVETTSGVAGSIEVKPSYGLSELEVERMIRESAARAGGDMQARRLKEAQLEGMRAAEAIDAAFETDGEMLLDEHERATIHEARDTLRTQIAGTDADAIRAATERLEACSEDYVARRMNAGIRQALQGHSTGEFE